MGALNRISAEPVTSVSEAADVFSAIGTVGAFGVAMYLLRNEQQRETDRREDARRAQAARVSAWLETRATPKGGRELLFPVRNASDMPIYEESLPTMTPGQTDTEAQFIGLVPPGRASCEPHHVIGSRTTSRPNRPRSSSLIVVATTEAFRVTA
jgi:hypothetical protein